MKWYADYLSIYDKPFTQAPQAVINQVKDKIRQLATHAPLVSVVAIAHNEEKRILFACGLYVKTNITIL